MCNASMRPMTLASRSAASPPVAGGATITFAPSARNSCVSFRSASRFTFSSAEQIAAPLVSAISATVSRPRLAPSSLHRIRGNIERRATPSLTPQHGGGIEARSAPKREEAPQQRHRRGERQNDGEQNPAQRGSHAENFDAQRAGQQNSQNVSENSAYERKKQLLGHKKRADGAAARAQRFHQSDFRPPLEHGRRGGRADRQRRCEQRGERHEPHQAADARQDAPFSFGDLTNRAHVHSRKLLLNLA